MHLSFKEALSDRWTDIKGVVLDMKSSKPSRLGWHPQGITGNALGVFSSSSHPMLFHQSEVNFTLSQFYHLQHNTIVTLVDVYGGCIVSNGIITAVEEYYVQF